MIYFQCAFIRARIDITHTHSHSVSLTLAHSWHSHIVHVHVVITLLLSASFQSVGITLMFLCFVCFKISHSFLEKAFPFRLFVLPSPWIAIVYFLQSFFFFCFRLVDKFYLISFFFSYDTHLRAFRPNLQTRGLQLPLKFLFL